MKKIICLVLIYLPVFTGIAVFAAQNKNRVPVCNLSDVPDSLRDRQFLYNGTEWKNPFRRITGDQYLFSNIFLPGSVTFNGRTFVNLKIRYDIYSDEIMIPRSLEQIILLNKEMVDSFYFVFANKFFKFKKIDEDSPTVPKGYVNVLYEGRSALYIKYVKKISTDITDYSDGSFYQVYTIYFVKNGVPLPVTGMKDIYRILVKERNQIREYISKNKLKVTRNEPESFVPVIRYYDSLSK